MYTIFPKVPGFNVTMIAIKRYAFSSQIRFDKKFLRFTFSFKNLLLLQIVADVNVLLTLQPRHTIAISPIDIAIFFRTEFLLLTSLHPQCKIILLGAFSVSEGKTLQMF